jgi:accessory colonization factor AcfC
MNCWYEICIILRQQDKTTTATTGERVMKLTQLQKQKIEEAWIQGTASDAKKVGVWVDFKGMAVKFFTVDEFRNLIEMQVYECTVKRGLVYTRSFYALSPEEAITSIETMVMRKNR